jgi:hypothetical protein
MSVAENAALSRRVGRLEGSITNQELVLVRTTIVVCERGDEADYSTTAEIIAAAEIVGPNPPVREVKRWVDLELLIDPVTGKRKLRHRQRSPEALAKFEALASAARAIDVEIRCHERQLAAIVSDYPIEAVYGGNRAGKSMALAWWLFRRWMLRGGVGCKFWWIAPTGPKAIEFGAWLIAGHEGLGDGALWPVDVFAGLARISLEAKSPVITLIDGSSIGFLHAHHSGRRAGDNLRSANVRDIVVDELTSIHDRKNWQQLIARVSQSGGHILTASTRGSGHWSLELVEGNAATAGGAIHVSEVDLFHNPWMAYAAIWQMFLNDKTFTEHQIGEIITLPRAEQADAARARCTRPESLLNHFGVSVEASDRLWTEWTGTIIFDRDQWHDTLTVTDRDGRPKTLRNITAELNATRWPRLRENPPRAWAGMDFNVIGHAVVFELFGEGRTIAEAFANQASWHVLVTAEVEVQGTTLRLAEKLRATAGSLPMWCDPNGAMIGNDARGTGGSTDVAEVRKAGFHAAPANGYSQPKGDGKASARWLSVADKRNVMHRLMADRRLYVHARCTGLLDALEHDKPTKTSGVHSVSDRRSGYSDAAAYGLFPAFAYLLALDKAA